MSDDMKRCEIIRCGDSLQSFHDKDTWQKPKDLKAANAQGADKVEITPVAAAALLHALLKATDHRLAGCFPNANPGLAAGAAPVQSHLFIVGDFLVIDVQTNLIKIRRATDAQGGLRLYGATSPRARRRVSLEPHFVSI